MRINTLGSFVATAGDLSGSGVISGRFIDSDGTPIPGRRVLLAERESMNAVAIVPTGPRGEWSYSGLSMSLMFCAAATPPLSISTGKTIILHDRIEPVPE